MAYPITATTAQSPLLPNAYWTQELSKLSDEERRKCANKIQNCWKSIAIDKWGYKEFEISFMKGKTALDITESFIKQETHTVGDLYQALHLGRPEIAIELLGKNFVPPSFLTVLNQPIIEILLEDNHLAHLVTLKTAVINAFVRLNQRIKDFKVKESEIIFAVFGCYVIPPEFKTELNFREFAGHHIGIETWFRSKECTPLRLISAFKLLQLNNCLRILHNCLTQCNKIKCTLEEFENVTNTTVFSLTKEDMTHKLMDIPQDLLCDDVPKVLAKYHVNCMFVKDDDKGVHADLPQWEKLMSTITMQFPSLKSAFYSYVEHHGTSKQLFMSMFYEAPKKNPHPKTRNPGDILLADGTQLKDLLAQIDISDSIMKKAPPITLRHLILALHAMGELQPAKFIKIGLKIPAVAPKVTPISKPVVATASIPEPVNVVLRETELPPISLKQNKSKVLAILAATNVKILELLKKIREKATPEKREEIAELSKSTTLEYIVAKLIDENHLSFDELRSHLREMGTSASDAALSKLYRLGDEDSPSISAENSVGRSEKVYSTTPSEAMSPYSDREAGISPRYFAERGVEEVKEEDDGKPGSLSTSSSTSIDFSPERTNEDLDTTLFRVSAQIFDLDQALVRMEAKYPNVRFEEVRSIVNSMKEDSAKAFNLMLKD